MILPRPLPQFLLLFVTATTLHGADVSYPPHAQVINVRDAGAKGDGMADDTAALQRVVNEHTGRHRILWFPPGTYLVSATLTWPKKWNGKDNWGFTTLQGANPATTILRLKDGTFTDPKKPQAIMWCGGFGSADWFHTHVRGLTFDVGRGNPGAVGLQFYANNYGAVRDCRFVSGDGQGVCGLDLAHRDMNGPLLVRGVEVRGFAKGIRAGHAVNSQTLENITLAGQTEVGLENEGQALSIRGLRSENSVPAVRTYGLLALLDAKLTGTGGAAKLPAIVNYNGGRIFLRDLATTGYARALGDVSGTPDMGAAFRLTAADKAGGGPDLAEYSSHPATSPFPSPATSLRLPVLETPEVPADDPTTWAVVDAFGADPTGQKDSSAAIQKAIDSGATTVFLPGSYALQSTVVVRGKVRRLLGVGGQIDYPGKTKPDFRIADGAAPVLVLEHFASIGGGVEIATDRTVVFRSLGVHTIVSKGRGDVFLEDVATGDLAFTQQRVFARQLNLENEGTHLVNDGGALWILGYKTERGGTLIETRGGGKTEVFGTFSYTTTAGKLAPMFVNKDSAVFTFFREVCYNGDPFTVLIREQRGAEVKEVLKGAGDTMPYSGRQR